MRDEDDDDYADEYDENEGIILNLPIPKHRLMNMTPDEIWEEGQRQKRREERAPKKRKRASVREAIEMIDAVLTEANRGRESLIEKLYGELSGHGINVGSGGTTRRLHGAVVSKGGKRMRVAQDDGGGYSVYQGVGGKMLFSGRTIKSVAKFVIKNLAPEA